jgi:hypothetical protein
MQMKLAFLMLFIPLFQASSQDSTSVKADSTTSQIAISDTAANPIFGFEGGAAKYQNISGAVFNFTFYTSVARHAQIGFQVLAMNYTQNILYPDVTTYPWHLGLLLTPTYVIPGKTLDYSVSLGAGAVFPWVAVAVPAFGIRYKMSPSLNATATLRTFFSYRDSSATPNKLVVSPLVLSIGIQLNR